jgi:hypothetical protein
MMMVGSSLSLSISVLATQTGIQILFACSKAEGEVPTDSSFVLPN